MQKNLPLSFTVPVAGVAVAGGGYKNYPDTNDTPDPKRM